MNCTGKRCLAQYNKVDPATCTAVPYCPQATPPKTNADRIHNMTYEELASWINDHADCNRRCEAWKDGCMDSDSTCRAAWLEWLKEEVKE